MGEVRLMIESHAGRRFARLAQDLEAEVDRDVRGFVTDAELALQAVTPKRSTRLARSMHTFARGHGVWEVVSEARNPETGYQYTGVTRFGHRKVWIYPTRRGPAARVLTTMRPRARGKRAALRIPIGGGAIIFRRRVHGVKVDHDWVLDAMPVIQVEARLLITRIGQRVTRGFGA